MINTSSEIQVNGKTIFQTKPNFLIIIVDEERFPPTYEDEAIKAWRDENFKAQNFLRKNGIEFNNHHAASTACSPSRTTLYTGQYPSLHGVSQTDGVAKSESDPEMFWLDPSTVPTIGDYLRTAGYDTFWKGKWHASFSDILIPDTHNSYLSYDSVTGIPIPEREQIYLNANRLEGYGFNGWIGPEPHGSSPRNSGSSAAIGLSGRDEVYSKEVVELLQKLQQEKMVEDEDKPWAIVASFVNPHDIALFGAYTRLYPLFSFDIDDSVPPIPPAPTSKENLYSKPKCQASYHEVYPEALQPLLDTETYRRLYYSLQLKVDKEVYKILEALNRSIFYENTIILFTSDHGDLLGSHGGLFQKWYQAYEEAIHVPFIVHNPKLVPQSKTVDILTSHVDILPTILELAEINTTEALKSLKENHTEVHPLVGRDLTPLIVSEEPASFEDTPIYFMTDDDVTKGQNQTTFFGVPYESVVQPNHIETVIAKLPTGTDNELETWKYSRYFDNPQFWDEPGCMNSSSKPVPDEFEMYNLTADPIESKNLVNPQFATVQSAATQAVLAKLLEEECQNKRLYPSSGNVPGKPSCQNCAPDFRI